MDDNHTKLNPKDNMVQAGTTSHNKESEPIGISSAQELMEPIRAPELSKEVAGYIEQREKMKVPPDLKSMGVQATDDVHGSTGPTFPISDEKIEEGLHQPVNSSWRWLSQFLLYHLQKMHLTLKKVHGHVVRVARG